MSPAASHFRCRALSGENFTLEGGFWSAITAIQTPGAPLLSTTLNPLSNLTVSWPSPSNGFTLQQNTNLNTTNWVTPSASVTDDGTNKFILVNPPPGMQSHRVYRLFKP